MSATTLTELASYRLVRYETPAPCIYEVWHGDDLIFHSYWRSSAMRKLRRLVAYPA